MADTDWIAWANALVRGWGLNSAIAGNVIDLVQQGYQNEALVLQLRQTKAYTDRFPAMATMVARGWDEGTYVKYETKMLQLETDYGLPVGTLSSRDQVAKMATSNLDEAQIEKRVKVNYAAALQVPTEVKQAMRDYYGVTDTQGALTAYYLDPTRSVELLQDQLMNAQIGGAAIRQGLTLSEQTAARLNQQGISEDEANTGFQKVRSLEALTSGVGDVVTNEDLIASQFGGVEAAQKASRIAGGIGSQFQGGGGAATGQQGASGLASSAG